MAVFSVTKKVTKKKCNLISETFRSLAIKVPLNDYQVRPGQPSKLF